MIVPELLDIAEQLKIPNAKKMDKQELVYKILDNQAIAGAKTGAGSGDAKNRQRKRIVKATTGNTTEEAIVESNDKKPVHKKCMLKRRKTTSKKRWWTKKKNSDI
jgi:transcription termination factor Rho